MPSPVVACLASMAACTFDPIGGTGSLDAGEPDAALADAATSPDTAAFDAPPSGFPYTPHNFDLDGLEPLPPVVLDCGEAVLDTTLPAFVVWCASLPEPVPVVRTQGNGSQVAILPVTGFAIDEGSSLRVVGDRPLVIAVFGDASIAGVLFAGAEAGDPGPGADHACAGVSGEQAGDNGGGGGGGGFGSDGGDGGDGANDAEAGAGSPEVGDAQLSPLRGGCPGGAGGPGNSGVGGMPGGGGGAVQVSVAGTLLVSGVVATPGGGGGGASLRDGGGGGGSGGAILLEAAGLEILAGAKLTANGGGGGEGGSACSSSLKPPGEDGHPEDGEPAAGGAGGTNSGGDGGAGAVADSDAAGGDDGAIGSFGACVEQAGGGGGGGGGTGRIRLVAATSCAVASDGPLFTPGPELSGACR